MNRQESDILIALANKPFSNQRTLADQSGHSLGIVNQSLKSLVAEQLLTEDYALTDKAISLIKNSSPKSAIILAAGYGMRMVPINMEISKGMLEVGGEPLVERTIKQLQEAGIKDIQIVVGFMKEQYDYLIDKYDVKLVINKDYAAKNNIHSLNLALKKVKNNTYIIPCDIWCKENPYSDKELYSWYMLGAGEDATSPVRYNRKIELAPATSSSKGNKMIGISYFEGADVAEITDRVEEICADPRNDSMFWEEALHIRSYMPMNVKVVDTAEVFEINTYEQLREIDKNSNNLKSDALSTIAQAFGVKESEIVDITVLKKGMTNRSFLFSCKGQRYIMRIPGEGTDQLINRKEEASVYEILKDRNICDDIIYINPDNGYKVTRYIENARVCDSEDVEDLTKCMAKLRAFHEMKLKVEHEFKIFGQIEFYETLWNGDKSIYKDYDTTKANVMKLQDYINSHRQEMVLTHIDAVPDNFLFGEGQIRLIDWEYAGMQDPHVDIAMFCIYSLYEREQVDRLIDIYFEGKCDIETRIKIYCYVASCGLLWSNWCEYKRALGVEFGEYSLKQYRYAKDFYKIVVEELKKIGGEL